MNKMILKAALLASIAVASNAKAAGVPGQGTWETTLLGRDINGAAVLGSDASAVFLYDTVLNVTWLRNANVNGMMTWNQANTWAANLTVGTYNDWRLPAVNANPDTTWTYSGTDHGYNVRTMDGTDVYSEMATLYYNTLGNNSDRDQFGNAQPGGLTNAGDFQNLPRYIYWSLPENTANPTLGWTFAFENGSQGFNYAQTPAALAIAVRDGDVLVTPVPEPETYALMLAGLAVVGAAARRRQSVNTGSKMAAP